MAASTELIVRSQQEHQAEEHVFTDLNQILETFSKMQANLTDISVLKKFYITNKPFPFDTSTWCRPILYGVLKKQLVLRTTYENFWYILKKLERYGLIKQIKHSNPSVFEPIEEISVVVRRAMVLWLAKHGIQLL